MFIERKIKNAEKIFKKADFAEICMKQIISKMQSIVRKKQARQAMEPRSCVAMSVAKGVTADPLGGALKKQ